MGTTSATGPAGDAATVSGLRITYALFGGSLAWMTHLIAQSTLTGFACETGRLWPIHAVTVATLLATLHALWVGWSIRRNPDPSRSVQAARFLGFAAVVINVFNVAMIVVEWVPVVFIPPCSVG